MSHRSNTSTCADVIRWLLFNRLFNGLCVCVCVVCVVCVARGHTLFFQRTSVCVLRVDTHSFSTDVCVCVLCVFRVDTHSFSTDACVCVARGHTLLFLDGRLAENTVEARVF